MSTSFSETYEDIAKGKLQICRFQPPNLSLRQFSKKSPRISTNNVYCPKLKSLAYIFAADSMGLCLLLFTQLSLKFEPSESKTAGTIGKLSLA